MINKTMPEFSLEALKSGEPNEFARFVDTYSGPIYRMALKMLGDQQDAEDVLQNTFFRRPNRQSLPAYPRFRGTFQPLHLALSHRSQ
ncbi:MAG: sigma factor [Anaerolineales bacterium]|nr:sigma factor [Anaerolineales bacterium]